MLSFLCCFQLLGSFYIYKEMCIVNSRRRNSLCLRNLCGVVCVSFCLYSFKRAQSTINFLCCFQLLGSFYIYKEMCIVNSRRRNSLCLRNLCGVVCVSFCLYSFKRAQSTISFLCCFQLLGSFYICKEMCIVNSRRRNSLCLRSLYGVFVFLFAFIVSNERKVQSVFCVACSS